MKIEVLYPEVGCLFGDIANVRYLEQCFPDAEFIKTSLNDEPRFVYEPVDLVYMGSMSEHSQEMVLERLMKVKNVIHLLLDDEKTVFLMTGNAFEVFGEYIQREDGSRVEGLGLIPTHSVRQTPDRFNSVLMGTFNDMTVLGYTSRFSHTWGNSGADCLFKITKGTGSNPDSMLEGYHRGKFYGTYFIGPILVINPDFALHIFREMGVENMTLPFEAEARLAFEKRLADTKAATVLRQ